VNRLQELYFQFAALPYRQLREAVFEVMLITSRDTGRWVLPKGWPVPGETAWDCAAREAREEAGLTGKIQSRPLGRYHYSKPLDSGLPVWCTVEVFPLEFVEQLAAWPEQGERVMRWFAIEYAAQAVDESDLASLIRDLPRYALGRA
jgi:8-oxo-dGTP pyrophosphatase MutT (NUDIX family)